MSGSASSGLPAARHPRLGWVLVAVQFLLLVALVASAAVPPRREPAAWALATGALLGVLGVLIGAWSMRSLGQALTPTPVPRPGMTLRTEGAYRLVRHPIYSGVLLLATGFAVAVGTYATVACLVLLVVFFAAKARWEDRMLAEMHGATWQVWSQRTGRLVPGIGRTVQRGT